MWNNSFFVSRRSKIFWAFVSLAITFLIIFSAVFYYESGRNWENQKYKALAWLITDIQSVAQAERYFSDIRVIAPNGRIVLNEGIFTELPPNIVSDNRMVKYDGMSLYVISKVIPNGFTILFVDDITDAVESQRLMFGNLLTSTIILWILVIIIWWFFTRGIFGPVNRIVEAIEQFQLEQDPKQDVIPIVGKETDEFVRIARQLESLFARVRMETTKIEDLSSNIAHELKNSLFGIASTLELALLLDHPKQKIEQVHVQVLHLGEVVQTLLLLANKEVQLPKTWVSLISIFDKFTKEDIRISMEGNPEITWDIHQELFEIALGNIIGNAQKFTPDDGKIQINFSENSIQIIDTGTGISAEQLPFVFDRFYKADSMRPNGSGTGLWLTLSKHILEKLHGFTLSISSTLGSGTCVTITRLHHS